MHSPAYSRVNLGIPLRARRTLESHLFLARWLRASLETFSVCARAGLLLRKCPQGTAPLFQSACALIGRQRALSPCGLRQPKGHALLRPARPLSRVGAGIPPRFVVPLAKALRLGARFALLFPLRPLRVLRSSALLPPAPFSRFRSNGGGSRQKLRLRLFWLGWRLPRPRRFFRRAIALSGARARLVLWWQWVSFRPFPPPFPARERERRTPLWFASAWCIVVLARAFVSLPKQRCLVHCPKNRTVKIYT